MIRWYSNGRESIQKMKMTLDSINDITGMVKIGTPLSTTIRSYYQITRDNALFFGEDILNFPKKINTVRHYQIPTKICK